VNVVGALVDPGGVLPEMSKPGKNRRHGGKQAVTDRWQRWQLVATVVRIVVDLLDRFAGGGPGRLL
jgi:hypothetical protein